MKIFLHLILLFASFTCWAQEQYEIDENCDDSASLHIAHSDQWNEYCSDEALEKQYGDEWERVRKQLSDYEEMYIKTFKKGNEWLSLTSKYPLDVYNLIIFKCYKSKATCKVCIEHSSGWNELCADRAMKKTYGDRWQEAKQFFFDFQDAVRESDRQRVAKMINYPLNIYYPEGEGYVTRIIKDEQEFIECYDKIFYDEIKSYIANLKYIDLGISGGTGSWGFNYGIVCQDAKDFSNTCTPYLIKIYILGDPAIPRILDGTY